MATLEIVSLPGDGVGPEVTRAMQKVLEHVGRVFGHQILIRTFPVGFASWETHGTPLTDEALEACLASQAVFLGAVGDPRSDGLPPRNRPEAALLRLRAELGVHANLRPARVDPALTDVTPLRPEVARGVDFVIVRELTGGIYYGEPRSEDSHCAVNTMTYRTEEIERVARFAFETAAARRGRLTSVDKANVLEVSRLWRRVVEHVAAEYPRVATEHMLVDRAAMELILNPGRFDVILTANLFGDILSDEAAAICGSLGVLPSASLGEDGALYEPVHGSAPDIAGRNRANPVAAILTMAMMLDHTFDLTREARAVEAAVSRVLAGGLRTADIAPPDGTVATTQEFTQAVMEEIR